MAHPRWEWLVAAYVATGVASVAYWAGHRQGRATENPQLEPAGGGISWRGVALALAPGVLFMVLYFTLAARFHWSPGGWRGSGTVGVASHFSQWHRWTTGVAGIGVAVHLLPLPLVLLALLPTREGRRMARYVWIFAAGLGMAWGLTHLAPASFRNWFWD